MRAVVIGGGSWGTAVARLLARGGHRTTLACRDAAQAEMISRRHRNPRYLYDIELPPDLDASPIGETSFDGAELVALAVPSRAFAATVAAVADRLPQEAVLLSLTKGLDPGDRRRMSEILAEVAPAERIAVLSGPNHAEEVARDLPTASVLASCDAELARCLQGVLAGPTLRVYTSSDVVGVELCAAAKNVVALAAGASDGLGFGDNAKAAIITRGMAEMARLGSAFGAQQRTYSGLAGHGRPDRHLHVAALAQPARRRAAGERRAGRLDRAGARPGGRGPVRPCPPCGASPTPAASSCRSPAPSAPWPGRARPCSRRWPT